MKKLFLMAAALFAAISFSACSDDDDNGGKSAKTVLVKQVIFTEEDNNQSKTHTIEYDDQGRICRMTSDDPSSSTYSYSYSDNSVTMTITDGESHEYIMTCELNADGYIVKASDPYEPEGSFHFVSYNNNGYLERWYTNFLTDQQRRYSWENGNLVSVKEPGAWEQTITYTQIAATPINFCVDAYIGNYPITELSFWGFMGKQSKYLPKKVVLTRTYDTTRTTTFKYEFNADQTISKISIEEITEGTHSEERYHNIRFVY